MNTAQFLTKLTELTGDKSPSLTWTNINGTLELHTKVMINNEEVHCLHQVSDWLLRSDACDQDGVEAIFFKLTLDAIRRRMDSDKVFPLPVFPEPAELLKDSKEYGIKQKDSNYN